MMFIYKKKKKIDKRRERGGKRVYTEMASASPSFFLSSLSNQTMGIVHLFDHPFFLFQGFQLVQGDLSLVSFVGEQGFELVNLLRGLLFLGMKGTMHQEDQLDHARQRGTFTGANHGHTTDAGLLIGLGEALDLVGGLLEMTQTVVVVHEQPSRHTVDLTGFVGCDQGILLKGSFGGLALELDPLGRLGLSLDVLDPLGHRLISIHLLFLIHT